MTETSTGASAGARQPVRLVLTPRAARPPRVPLLTWIHQRPEFRAPGCATPGAAGLAGGPGSAMR
ncbi:MULTISPECIES: hypothetical protein [unclassified Micromonospora]|uniref:hypothetical protein n=1 Tax=unclassified Micromonospora TaxID=2617518 RepID=UPI001183F603|nr:MULTISPECIES: hypothetical protein [unclassified Micromonospora]MDI5942578.1 hypothetical protein [Micromonospora sp. DH15]